ncbi:MAG TPA: L,D-transpeptidase [Xanthobacteraceae bacterium]|jgi:lipoprotein-anchoring transpeptidase ErfK/SrfK
MFLRTATILAGLSIGLFGTANPVLAQFFPPQYFPQRPVAPVPTPPVDVDQEAPNYGSPQIYSQPLPPPPQDPAYGAQPPAYGAQPQYGRAYPPPQDSNPPPVYLAPPPGYQPVPPASPPAYGALPAYPYQPGAVRPPGAVGPGAVQQAPSAPGANNSVYASLPPEDRPEVGPQKELPPQFRRTEVEYRTREPAGTIVIDTPNTYLYLVLGNGKALRYGIGVGREGFTWSGAERVSRMAEWPDWYPPPEMIERQPYLPRWMAGGEGNPLGARALYLGKTLYRIHGTNQPSTIGSFVSSGCIRLTNDDIADLYGRVQVGTRVVVLPGPAPATASAAPIGPAAAPAPYNPIAPPPRR